MTKKKDLDIEKMDKAFKKLQKKLEKDPMWQAWMESGGPQFLERAARELDKVKPSFKEMLLDVVEAGWVLESPGGDFSFLAKKKKDVITALWKLTQIVKGNYQEGIGLVRKRGRRGREKWPKQFDG